jgi:hypothetical protein
VALWTVAMVLKPLALQYAWPSSHIIGISIRVYLPTVVRPCIARRVLGWHRRWPIHFWECSYNGLKLAQFLTCESRAVPPVLSAAAAFAS